MQESARILGEKYGVTAAEMNYILKKKGYLDGRPGGYWLTELGKKYGTEKGFHRGTGGYERYNRYWTEITWDSGIEKELRIKPGLKQEAQDFLQAWRKTPREVYKAQELAERAIQMKTTGQGIATSTTQGVSKISTSAQTGRRKMADSQTTEQNPIRRKIKNQTPVQQHRHRRA